MESPEFQQLEQESAEIQSLESFDMQYFQELEGQDGWLALEQENCMNQRYFTIKPKKAHDFSRGMNWGLFIYYNIKLIFFKKKKKNNLN